MRRFDFPLDPVLTVKRKLELLAVMKQQRAQENLCGAQVDLGSLTDRLSEVSNHMTSGLGQAVSASHWVAASAYSDRIGQAIAISERIVAEAAENLELAERERTEIATQIESLDTIRRDRWDAWKHEDLKDEQTRLDEISIRRWENAREEAARSK